MSSARPLNGERKCEQREFGLDDTAQARRAARAESATATPSRRFLEQGLDQVFLVIRLILAVAEVPRKPLNDGKTMRHGCE